jgi:20S proteasome subunit alpha 4
MGLKADTCVLINHARVECWSYRLIVEDPVIIEYIDGLRQKYTQSGGVCPFGLSTLIVGFDPYTEKPALYQIDPHWVPSLLGRLTPQEGTPSLCMSFWRRTKETSGKEPIKLSIRTLLEVYHKQMQYLISWNLCNMLQT